MASLSYEEAAHLLRRAGFGGTSAEIDDLSSRGREGAVDHLINYSQIDNSAMDNLLAASFDFTVADDSSILRIVRPLGSVSGFMIPRPPTTGRKNAVTSFRPFLGSMGD